MTSRDYIGYGRTPPRVEWPNGARLAVSVVVNYEEGAEYSPLDGDPIGGQPRTIEIPVLYGGADGPDVLLMQRTETWIAKGGAEGLLCAVDLATNTGIALKAEDGAHRAIAPALAAFVHVHLPTSLVKNTRDEIVGDLSLRTTSA